MKLTRDDLPDLLSIFGLCGLGVGAVIEFFCASDMSVATIAGFHIPQTPLADLLVYSAVVIAIAVVLGKILFIALAIFSEMRARHRYYERRDR